ncbi:MAG: hypothetical protein QOJ20_5730 [Mycobacterium sp.]|nr:hypothetical protein [Mycobacterium sp.]
MSDNSRAYNSVWQLRGDAWCRLEEAADRLTRPTTQERALRKEVRSWRRPDDEYVCREPYASAASCAVPRREIIEDTPEGDVRRAFYLSYNDANCEYLSGEEIFEKLDAGIDVVSATFVTPYPPGFPVLVPGQVFSREILTFIRDLDTPEIHGYEPEVGYRVYTEKAMEMCRPGDAPVTNGYRPAPAESPEPVPTEDTSQPSPRKTGAKRSGKPPEAAPAPA